MNDATVVTTNNTGGYTLATGSTGAPILVQDDVVKGVLLGVFDTGKYVNLAPDTSERADTDSPIAPLSGTLDPDGIGASDEKAVNMNRSVIGGQNKQENGLDYPSRDYAYIPSLDQPATWRLRMSESPGKVTLRQLMLCVNAISSPSQSIVPQPALASVKRRLLAEFRKLNAGNSQIPQVLTKELGDYWFAVYSNNRQDSDGDIITKESHERFVEMVADGTLPLPELRIHHVALPVGQTLWLDYVDEFAVALGEWTDQAVKEAVQSYDGDIGVSHGMPHQLLVRNPTASHEIIFHVTKEISLLPIERAANAGTVFVSKENNMQGLTDARLASLKTFGVSEERIAELEKGLSLLRSGTAEVTSKENDGDAPAVAPVASTPAAPDMEVVGAIVEMLTPILDAVRVQSERIAALELAAKDNAQLSKDAASTPRASLGELIAEQLFGKEARVRKNDPLLKETTKEAPAIANQTGTFLDSFLS